MLRAGVRAFASKRDSVAQLGDAIRAVLSGNAWITPELAAVIAGDSSRRPSSAQQERAVALYASGLTINAIATRLDIEPETAAHYLDRGGDQPNGADPADSQPPSLSFRPTPS